MNKHLKLHRNAGLTAASVFVVALCASGAAQATVVTSFDSSYTSPGSWYEFDMRFGGTASIVDLSGQGGNLENHQPLATGAALLTTDGNSSSKAEVAVSGGLGTVGAFLAGGTLGYSFYKSSIGDGNAFAAPAIKLTVQDATIDPGHGTDGYATFVFEPTWNGTPPGGSTAVPTNDWITEAITGTSGLFWSTGIYGDPNTAGGPPLLTLADWNSRYSGDLASADILAISIGVGSGNLNQTGYFDNVSYTSGSTRLSYNFEAPAPVPIPAALPLLLSGVGGMGLLGWRRKHKVAAQSIA